MILIISTSLVLVVALTSFQESISSDVSSSIISVFFGVASLSSVIYGDYLRRAALYVDRLVLRYLPVAVTNAYRVLLPAPELSIFIVVLLIISVSVMYYAMTRIGLAIGRILVNHDVTNIKFDVIGHSIEYLVKQSMISYIGAVCVPFLMLYGYTLVLRNRFLSLPKIMMAISIGLLSCDATYKILQSLNFAEESESADGWWGSGLVLGIIIIGSVSVRIGEGLGKLRSGVKC